jgi:hypothetical protein
MSPSKSHLLMMPEQMISWPACSRASTISHHAEFSSPHGLYQVILGWHSSPVLLLSVIIHDSFFICRTRDQSPGCGRLCALKISDLTPGASVKFLLASLLLDDEPSRRFGQMELVKDGKRLHPRPAWVRAEAAQIDHGADDLGYVEIRQVVHATTFDPFGLCSGRDRIQSTTSCSIQAILAPLPMPLLSFLAGGNLPSRTQAHNAG